MTWHRMHACMQRSQPSIKPGKMRGALVYALALVAVGALYEEPPGGCKAPPEALDAFTQPTPKRALRQNVPAPSPPPPPPPENPEEEAERLERELYERESVAAMAGLGAVEDDWDAIEKEHAQSLFRRRALSLLVTVLGVLYAISKIWEHLSPPKAASPPPKSDAKEPAAAAAPSADDATPAADAKKADPDPKAAEAVDSKAAADAAATAKAMPIEELTEEEIDRFELVD